MKITKYDIFAIVFDTILIIILSLFLYLAKEIDSSKIVYIPKGSINKIISYLGDRNFELSKVDAFLLRFFGKPQSGWVYIGKNRLSRGDFLYKLTHSKAPMITIKLIPGETKEIFFKNVAKTMGLSYEKLLYYYKKIAPYKDGVIFADSYNIPMGMSERHLISYLVGKSLHQHRVLSKKIFGKFDENRWFWYVSIASIIQKEAANDNEMPLVSAVIHNRLKKGMKLQMDGSLKYGLNSHKKITHDMIKNDKSEYNTYYFKGVPKDPVCSISLAALKSAIFPAKKRYFYFVKGKNGKHIFSKTYKNHLINLRK